MAKKPTLTKQVEDALKNTSVPKEIGDMMRTLARHLDNAEMTGPQAPVLIGIESKPIKIEDQTVVIRAMVDGKEYRCEMPRPLAEHFREVERENGRLEAIEKIQDALYPVMHELLGTECEDEEEE